MISFRRRLRVGVETSRMGFIGEPSFEGDARSLPAACAQTTARQAMQTESANLQSTFDYPRARHGPTVESGKTLFGVSECKPTRDSGIYLSILAAGRTLSGGPLNRLAGAWDFRDFSCLPPAEENRAQPADPAPVDHQERAQMLPENSL